MRVRACVCVVLCAYVCACMRVCCVYVCRMCVVCVCVRVVCVCVRVVCVCVAAYMCVSLILCGYMVVYMLSDHLECLLALIG